MKNHHLILLFLFSIGTSAQTSKKVQDIQEFQKELNASFVDPETTPLMPEDLEKFKNLKFFPIDTTFYVVADFVRTPYEMPFAMPTTTERKPLYQKYGEAHFSLKGKKYKLNLYQNLHLSEDTEYKNYLFLPFTDLTNGNSSYAGGRYLDMEIPVANKIILDFNKAYNPYCAYNGKYSCPIPPKENHMEVKITAGVKKF